VRYRAAGPSVEPQLAHCHRRSVGDYLRAAISAGFRIRRFDELARTRTAPARLAPEPVREIGMWPDWPWSLLGWAPEATKAAWDIPSVLVWQLELPIRSRTGA
jgi:hypothetical protein